MIPVKPRFRVEFIEVRYKGRVELPDALVDALPKKLVVFSAIQYHDQLPRLRELLHAAGKETTVVRPKHSVEEGHLLGCGIEHWDVEADAFLYIGDGLFHPKALTIHNEQPIYCYDPQREEWHVLENEDIERAKRRHKASMSRFLMARRVGVLVTTKSGQQRYLMARKLEEQYPEKEFYFFLSDTLDYGGLEDFPFVEAWVNTMCPRIGYDDTNKIAKPVVNIGELGFEW